MDERLHNSEEEERLLKSEEVAERLHISRSYAYLLMKRGDIPTVRVGGAIRVRPKTLDQYISQSESQNGSSIGSQTRKA